MTSTAEPQAHPPWRRSISLFVDCSIAVVCAAGLAISARVVDRAPRLGPERGLLHGRHEIGGWFGRHGVGPCSVQLPLTSPARGQHVGGSGPHVRASTHEAPGAHHHAHAAASKEPSDYLERRRTGRQQNQGLLRHWRLADPCLAALAQGRRRYRVTRSPWPHTDTLCFRDRQSSPSGSFRYS
jgi:hypothetical protein